MNDQPNVTTISIVPDTTVVLPKQFDMLQYLVNQIPDNYIVHLEWATDPSVMNQQKQWVMNFLSEHNYDILNNDGGNTIIDDYLIFRSYEHAGAFCVNMNKEKPYMVKIKLFINRELDINSPYEFYGRN